MKSNVIRWLVPFVLALSVGCWTPRSRQSFRIPDLGRPIEDAGKARIYVIRASSVSGAFRIAVYDGDQRVGSTGPETYLCWEREPGEMFLHDKAENNSKLMLNVEAGKVYYILQRMHMAYGWARTTLEELSEQDGLKYLKECTGPKVTSAQKD